MHRRARLASLLTLALVVIGLAPRPYARAATRFEPDNAADVETSLLILGDAGPGQSADDPVLRALARAIERQPDLTTVLFLGDNVSAGGMPADGERQRKNAERRLGVQIDAAHAARHVIFVPGNHDWMQTGKPGDWDAVGRQADLLAATGVAELRPTAGCPGPEILDVGNHVRLVFLDTEWWLRDLPLPSPSRSCTASTAVGVTRELDRVIGNAGARHVIIAGHHPSISAGPHGGRFDWMDHVFPFRALRPWLWIPLPLASSVYPVAREHGVFIQDQSHRTYRGMIAALRGAIEPHRPLLFVAGHKRQLGAFTGASIGTRYVAVSGAGHKPGAVDRIREALFTSRRPGFMRIDVLGDGRVHLAVSAMTSLGNANEVYQTWLE